MAAAKGLLAPIVGIVYRGLNNLGALSFLLLALALAWREQRRLKPLAPEGSRPFNMWLYMLCVAPSYCFLLGGVYLLGYLMVHPGCMAVYVGGVLVFIPMMLGLALFFPHNGAPARQLELLMPGLALQQFFNRMACTMAAGCCYGIPCRFGIVFPDTAWPSIAFGRGTRVFPSQPLEAAVMLLCFAALLWLLLRGKRILPVFPLTFGLTGFVLEFLSGESKGYILLGMNLQQWGYALVLCIGVIFLFFPRKEPQPGLV